MKTGDKKKILVADDEQGFRDLYVFFFEPLGFEVDCAVDGAEAVEKVRGRPYDLVLMDVHMPVMTGPEALREIRKIRPEQKVVIFSSDSDPTGAQESESKRLGVIACLYKPVDIDQVQKILTENIHPIDPLMKGEAA